MATRNIIPRIDEVGIGSCFIFNPKFIEVCFLIAFCITYLRIYKLVERVLSYLKKKTNTLLKCLI